MLFANTYVIIAGAVVVILAGLIFFYVFADMILAFI